MTQYTNANDFIYWLDGFLTNKYEILPTDVLTIKRKLDVLLDEPVRNTPFTKEELEETLKVFESPEGKERAKLITESVLKQIEMSRNLYKPNNSQQHYIDPDILRRPLMC